MAAMRVVEEICPFFESVDEMVLAIAEHAPNLAPPYWEIDKALIPYHYTDPPRYSKYNRSPYHSHSRRSFSNPETLWSLVRRSLKQHNLLEGDTAVKDKPQRSKSARRTDIYSAPAMACPSELDAIRGMDSNMRDFRAPFNTSSICDKECESAIFEHIEYVRASMEHFQENSAICHAAPANKPRTSIDSQQSNDSAIDLTEPPTSSPVRPILQRRERFTSDHVLRKRKHVQKEITEVSFPVLLPLKDSNDHARLVNSIPRGHERGLFEISLRPVWKKTLSRYPIPSDWTVTRAAGSQPAKKERPLGYFPDCEKQRQEALEKERQELLEKGREESLKNRRRPIYKFFRDYYQGGQSPIDTEWYEDEKKDEEFMEMRDWMHAEHLRQELEPIFEHQDHELRQCCIPYIPRCLIQPCVSRDYTEKPDVWYQTIEEAWDNRRKKESSKKCGLQWT